MNVCVMMDCMMKILDFFVVMIMFLDYCLFSILVDLLFMNVIVLGSLVSYVIVLNEFCLCGFNYWRFDVFLVIFFELLC